MGTSITFMVQGSQLDPYEVTVTSGDRVTCTCTCPAASRGGMVCKHRLRILAGNATAIVSDNVSDIATVVEWMRGTDLAAAVRDLAAAEDAVRTAQARVKSVKGRVASMMFGRS